MTIDNTNAITTEAVPQPIVIDFGKKSRKRIKKLRRGKPSRLMDKLTDVLQEMRDAGAMPASAQPVVVIVRERRRKTKIGRMWGMG